MTQENKLTKGIGEKIMNKISKQMLLKLPQPSKSLFIAREPESLPTMRYVLYWGGWPTAPRPEDKTCSLLKFS